MSNGAVLNFETQSTFEITVKAISEGGLEDVGQFVLTLLDVNEAPRLIPSGKLFVPEIPENPFQVGSPVIADDEDFGSSVSIILDTSATNDARFSVSATTGQIETNTGATFTAGETCFITLVALDQNLLASQPLTVEIEAIRGISPPQLETGQRFTVSEAASIGDAIDNSAIACTDPDNQELSFDILQTELLLNGTLQMVAGSGPFEIRGNRIHVAALLDFETQQSFSLVSCTDATSASCAWHRSTFRFGDNCNYCCGCR